MANLKVATKVVERSAEGNPLAVVFTFSDQSTLRMDLNELSDSIFTELVAHGLKQKAGDSFAGCKGDPIVARASAEAVWINLTNGIWSSRSDGGGILLEALMRLFPDRTAEDISSMLAGKDTKQKAAMRRHPQIKAKIKEIELERAKAGAIDTPLELDDLV